MFGRSTTESAAIQPEPEVKKPAAIWGRTCFALYNPKEDGSEKKYDHAWTVRKYANDWEFGLDWEIHVRELIRRIDELDADKEELQIQALIPVVRDLKARVVRLESYEAPMLDLPKPGEFEPLAVGMAPDQNPCQFARFKLETGGMISIPAQRVMELYNEVARRNRQDAQK